MNPLDRWLETATRGLGPASRERIRAEIEAHVRDQVEAATAAGAGPGRALRDAVAELGGPEASARAFRRIHLTAFQERFVRDYERPVSRRRRTLHVGLLLLGVAFGVWASGRSGHQVLAAALIATMAVSVTVLWLGARGLARRGLGRWAFLACVFAEWTLYAVLVCGMRLIDGSLTWLPITVFACALAALLVIVVPIVRKRRRGEDLVA